MTESKRVNGGEERSGSFGSTFPFHAPDAVCPLLECLESRVLLSDGALPVALQAPRAIAASSAAIFSKNQSTPTLCAEEDNVNVPLAIIKGRHHVSFTIEATHPTYVI